MYLRTLITLWLSLFAVSLATAQTTMSRGTNLSVDAARDGRVAMDLRGDLWVVPGGGGDAQQLTQNLGTVQRPRWSPDGSLLVYEAMEDRRPGVWLYDTTDATRRLISDHEPLVFRPSWHPGGERVLYSADVSGAGFDLWEVDVGTGLRWRLSDRPGDELDAAWSANGRDLVYVHRLQERWSLVLRRHSQPEEVLVTSDRPLAAPSWRPDGSLVTFFSEGEEKTTIDMVILSRPRLVRTYASSERFVASPVSWLDRHQMVYSADGQIRQRLFDDWMSSPMHFRASIQPQPTQAVERERTPLPWLDEPRGELVIHAARLFDGLSDRYRRDADVLINGGRIESIESHRDRPGKIVIDMGDLTVLPGLVDADARLPGRLRASHGPDLLASGITTIVADHADAERLNRLWSGKDVPGPRLLVPDAFGIGSTIRPELDVTAAVVTSRATGLASGAALPAQIRAMEIAGLTPVQTLRGMGVNAAAAMQTDPYLGRVAPGASADLVLVDGDPLENIDGLLNVVAVVRNGRFFSVSGLFDRAKQAENVE